MLPPVIIAFPLLKLVVTSVVALAVVKLPLLAVLAPIAVPSMYPPVTCALAVLKLVIDPVVPYSLVIPVMSPPVTCALPEPKLVINPVVPYNWVIPVMLPPVICALPELRFPTNPVRMLADVKLIEFSSIVVKLTFLLKFQLSSAFK